MISAVTSALGGIANATQRFEKAASTIATSGIQPNSEEPADSEAGSTGRPLDRGGVFGPSDTLAGAAIDAKIAEVTYKASIAVLQVADNLTEELLDITA